MLWLQTTHAVYKVKVDFYETFPWCVNLHTQIGLFTVVHINKLPINGVLRAREMLYKQTNNAEHALRPNRSLSEILESLYDRLWLNKENQNNFNLTRVLRFYFYAHIWHLMVKKPPRIYLEKKSNLFLFTHGDIKGSNFKDDGEPEIAMWPPKPKVLISPKVWQISSKFQPQT